MTGGSAILSNSDRDLIAASQERACVPSSSPSSRGRSIRTNPRTLTGERFFEESGAARDRHAHVAASLFHDIAPARELGLRRSGSTASARRHDPRRRASSTTWSRFPRRSTSSSPRERPETDRGGRRSRDRRHERLRHRARRPGGDRGGRRPPRMAAARPRPRCLGRRARRPSRGILRVEQAQRRAGRRRLRPSRLLRPRRRFQAD